MSEMVEIYTRHGCTYCDQAKNLLKIKGVLYFEHIIGDTIARERVIQTFPTVRTLPIVVINDQYIGGYQELVEYFENKDKEKLSGKRPESWTK